MRPATIEYGSFMLKSNLPLALKILADLIDADFLVPRRYGEEIGYR